MVKWLSQAVTGRLKIRVGEILQLDRGILSRHEQPGLALPSFFTYPHSVLPGTNLSSLLACFEILFRHIMDFPL